MKRIVCSFLGIKLCAWKWNSSKRISINLIKTFYIFEHGMALMGMGVCWWNPYRWIQKFNQGTVAVLLVSFLLCRPTCMCPDSLFPSERRPFFPKSIQSTLNEITQNENKKCAFQQIQIVMRQKNGQRLVENGKGKQSSENSDWSRQR